MLVGLQEGHPVCKKLVVGLLVETVAPVVTTVSINLSSNKIQNGDIRLTKVHLEKWPLKRRERIFICNLYMCMNLMIQIDIHPTLILT